MYLFGEVYNPSCQTVGSVNIIDYKRRLPVFFFTALCQTRLEVEMQVVGGGYIS